MNILHDYDVRRAIVLARSASLPQNKGAMNHPGERTQAKRK